MRMRQLRRAEIGGLAAWVDIWGILVLGRLASFLHSTPLRKLRKTKVAAKRTLSIKGTGRVPRKESPLTRRVTRQLPKSEIWPRLSPIAKKEKAAAAACDKSKPPNSTNSNHLMLEELQTPRYRDTNTTHPLAGEPRQTLATLSRLCFHTRHNNPKNRNKPPSVVQKHERKSTPAGNCAKPAFSSLPKCKDCECIPPRCPAQSRKNLTPWASSLKEFQRNLSVS